MRLEICVLWVFFSGGGEHGERTWGREKDAYKVSIDMPALEFLRRIGFTFALSAAEIHNE